MAALDFDTFKKNLKDGKYESLAGARRAVGKAQAFSAEEKESAKKLVDKHFGAAPQAEKKAPAGKKPAAKKTAEKPAKAAKATKVAPAAKRTAKASAETPVAKRQPRAAAAPVEIGGLNLEDLGSIGTQIRLAETICRNTTAALAALSGVGATSEDSDVQDTRNVMNGAIGIFRELVNQVSTKPESAKTRQPKVAAEVESEAPNGSLTRAEGLFAGSHPAAPLVD